MSLCFKARAFLDLHMIDLELMSGFLKSRVAMLVFNITMALLLLYSAVSILIH